MKIAIMGAGLSGLSCAITLERHGIYPTIFEKRGQVGDRFVNGEAFLPVFNKPIKDCYAYLSDHHGVYLQPSSNIRRITLFSEKAKAMLDGHLGFLNVRGRDFDSLECQLSRQVKSQIVYNSQLTYEKLLHDFTHVVLATGDAAYTAKIQDFQQNLTVTLKGATVEGAFDKQHVGIWLDNNLAPQGYGYLIPFSEKEATIMLGYPDYPENQSLDLQTLWERFYQRTCHDLDQQLKITDRFEVSRYIIGQCQSPRIGNTFFAGNCFGAIMPAFGFGQLAAILTGIYAANDLSGAGNYESSVKPLQESYRYSLALRRAMEQMDNHKLDILVGLLNSGMANRLVTSPHYDLLKLAGFISLPLLWKKRSV